MIGKKEESNIRIGESILQEDELEFTVKYGKETFTLKYPSPIERAAIELEISRRLGGQSRESFPESHLSMIESTAYVNALVVPEKSPEWFKSAWTCYDEECIKTLYVGYWQFRREIQKKSIPYKAEGDNKGSKS